MVKLFDLTGGKLSPSIHCHTLKPLKDIMDNYPDNHVKIYEYLFYMTSFDPDLNPFFDTPENDKEEIILKSIEADFSSEDPFLPEALEFCKDRFDTPTARAYRGAKAMLDKISIFLTVTGISANSKDGNGGFILSAMKSLPDLTATVKNAEKNLIEEQGRLRGGSAQAYDQK